MKDGATRHPNYLLLGACLVWGMYIPIAWGTEEAPQLQVPITVVSPGQSLLSQIESQIEILPTETNHPELSGQEQTTAREAREIDEIETVINEATEESQEMKDEVNDIDNDE